MNRFVLFVFALLLCSNSLIFGQETFSPGYVLTNSGDTLKGFINLRSNNANALSCEFKIVRNDSLKVFYPMQIKAYRVDGEKYYVSKEVVLDSLKRQLFLEYLVNGIVDLYFFKENSNDYYFIEKDGRVIQLNNNEKLIVNKYGDKYLARTNQYIGVLNYTYSDAPEFSNEIKKLALILNP